MRTGTFRVICLNCNGSNVAKISEIRDNEYIVNLDDDHRKTGKPTIISARYRRDMNFGFECVCGNDSRLARQEFQDIERLVVNGGESAIGKIAESLKTDDEKKFRMEVMQVFT